MSCSGFKDRIKKKKKKKRRRPAQENILRIYVDTTLQLGGEEVCGSSTITTTESESASLNFFLSFFEKLLGMSGREGEEEEEEPRALLFLSFFLSFVKKNKTSSRTITANRHTHTHGQTYRRHCWHSSAACAYPRRTAKPKKEKKRKKSTSLLLLTIFT